MGKIRAVFIIAVFTALISTYFNPSFATEDKIAAEVNNKCNLSGKTFLLYDPNRKDSNPATESRKVLFKSDEKEGEYLEWYWGSINETRSYFCNDGAISASGVGIDKYTGTYMPEKKQLYWNGYIYLEQ